MTDTMRSRVAGQDTEGQMLQAGADSSVNQRECTSSPPPSQCALCSRHAWKKEPDLLRLKASGREALSSGDSGIPTWALLAAGRPRHEVGPHVQDREKVLSSHVQTDRLGRGGCLAASGSTSFEHNHSYSQED